MGILPLPNPLLPGAPLPGAPLLDTLCGCVGMPRQRFVRTTRACLLVALLSWACVEVPIEVLAELLGKVVVEVFQGGSGRWGTDWVVLCHGGRTRGVNERWWLHRASPHYLYYRR